MGFAFCGFYTGQAEHTSWVHAISFLPWILWRFDVALQTRALRPAFEAGGLWGLSGLGRLSGTHDAERRFRVSVDAGAVLPSPRRRIDRPCRPRLSFGLVAAALVLFVGLPVLAPSYVAFFFEGGSGYSDRGSPTTAVRGHGSPVSG